MADYNEYINKLKGEAVHPDIDKLYLNIKTKLQAKPFFTLPKLALAVVVAVLVFSFYIMDLAPSTCLPAGTASHIALSTDDSVIAYVMNGQESSGNDVVDYIMMY